MSTFDPNDPAYDSKFSSPSDGPHVMKVANCELQTSSGGNPMIVIEFECAPPDEEVGRTVPWQYFVTTDNCLWKLADLCKALHPKVSAFNPMDQAEVNRALLGRHFVGIVLSYQDTYKGQTKVKTDVESYRYPSEATIGKLQTAAPGQIPSAPSAGAPAAPSAPQFNDDDIPF